MPKLARQYSDNLYYSDYHSVYSYTHFTQTKQQRYQELRNENRPRPQKRKRKSFIQFLTGAAFSAFLACVILPFGFSHFTKQVFVPAPYKNIQTDLKELAYPTRDYLVNSWFLGNRYFNYSHAGKNAQMIPIRETVNMPVLQSRLEQLGKFFPTVDPAVYVWDYETGNYVDINASKIYPTASIIKIPVLIDVFKSIEAGQFSLEDKMPLTEYYRTEGSGGLQFKAANSQYSIDELARHMITSSDNSATNMLVSKVGSMTDVNQQIRDWGLKDTAIQTWLPDYNGNNHSTARDMAQMLYNIDVNKDFLSETSRLKILDYMGHVHNDRLIPAGLGAGAVFLHKTGDIGKMLGDVGIVIAPNGKKYIVAIMVNRPHNSVAGKDYIIHASEIIYNYMVK